jgi:transmembrane protein 70
VHKLTWIPGSKEIELEMITWLATYERKVVSIDDIRPPKTNRPFVSFAVKDKFYFVDTDKIPNKDLLRIVTFYQSKK